MFTYASSNILTNGSFETPSNQKSKSTWRFYLADGWAGYAHPKHGNDIKVLTNGAIDGKRFIRQICKGKKTLTSMTTEKLISVSPGDQIFIETMIRGTGKAYIRIYWYNKAGVKQKKYFLDSRNATKSWEKFKTNVKVPEGVYSFALSLEIIASVGEIDFDGVKCTLSKGTILDNGTIKAVINPRLGGGIDSLKINGCTLDFGRPNFIGNDGGMFNLIIPSRRTPGELRFAQSKANVIVPNKKIEIIQSIDSGKLAGLVAKKTYELLPNNEIKVSFDFTNKSKKQMEVSCRIQSFVSSANGSFTWPTPDWIQVFHQDGKPLNGLNSIVNDLLRTGWIARYYKDAKATLLFTYDIKKSNRAYNYLMPNFATCEWYYRPFSLKPNESWKSYASLKVLLNQKDIYLDSVAIKNKVRVEEIKPIKMPPPPSGEPLPKIYQEFFPCITGLGNLLQPEVAGQTKSTSFYKLWKVAAMRQARVLADSYSTTIGGVHLVMDGSHREFYKTKDGKHEFGEFIKSHGLSFSIGRMMYHRKDTDVEAYKKRLPEIISVWKQPNLQKFVHTYADRLLHINTGDEPLPANIDVVLAANNELKKWMPKGVPIFTILNSSTVELMPYLPIFYADFYPVKRKSSSGANPWSVYNEFADKVKKAGDKPVWFMPQAFSAGEPRGYDIYAYPTDGEIRLMFHLAIVAGVKGISWYGFTNTGWQWVMNYYHLRQSPLNASAMPAPGWKAIVDCQKEVAGTGMLLLKSKPTKVPANCSIKTNSYTDSNGFYNGDAVKLFALKSPKGLILVAVNHNPQQAEKVTISVPVKGWDLSALKVLEAKTVTRTLAPGAAVYFYLGNDNKEIDAVFKGRYNREATRYLIAAKRAKGNNIPTINPFKFAKLPGRQAYSYLMKEFDLLNQRINAAPLGKAMKIITSLRHYLGHQDFELTRNAEYIVTPEMFKQTKRWSRYVKDTDVQFQNLKDKVIANFAQVNRLTDYLDNGNDAKNILPELIKLDKEARNNMENFMKAVVKRRKGAPAPSLRD
jgi:hypothetical protein